MSKQKRSPLRGALAEAGMTAEKLAKAIGIAPITMSRKINGVSAFTTREARLICEVLEVKELEARARLFLND